jgi:hypothetical protein
MLSLIDESIPAGFPDTFPLHRDLGRRVVDLAEIVGRKFDISGCDVLFENRW